MLYAIWMVLLISIDRLTKLWAERWLLPTHAGVLDAFPGVFRFYYVQNTGVAFSMLPNNRWLIIALNLTLILMIVVYLIAKKPTSIVLKLALVMIVAGGIGNMADRILYGYVIDFIDLTFMRFAVFNAADMYVSIGAVLCAICILLKGGEGHRGMDA